MDEQTPQTSSNSMTIIMVVIGLLVLGVVGFLFMRNTTPQVESAASRVEPEVVIDDDSTDPAGIEESLDDETTEPATVKTFEVTGSNFSFSVPEMKVNQGDTVIIVFSNADGMHDWVIDEFNARTPIIKAGETAEVTFVADQTGTFEYYCSVGQHRANGMKGNLIVE